jgi:hypothetical protein
MRKELRQIGETIKYVPNTIVPVSLPRVNVASRYQLRLKIFARHTALAAAQTYGVAVPNSPSTLIQRIDLRVTGVAEGARSQVLKSLSARDTFLMSGYLFQGAQENVDNMPAGTVSVAAGVTTSFGSYDLNFAIPDAREIGIMTIDPETLMPLAVPVPYRPREITLFNPRIFDPVELLIAFGDLTNLRTTTTPGVLVIERAEITVWEEALPEALGGVWLAREGAAETTWTGVRDDLRIELPRGNFIRRIWVQAFDNEILSNAIVNNVRVVENEAINRVDIAFNPLRMQNSKEYRIPFASLITGLAIVNFDTNLDLQGMLDVRVVESIRMSFNVNAPAVGVGRIRIITEEIVIT